MSTWYRCKCGNEREREGICPDCGHSFELIEEQGEDE
jgi:uncharacterized membrane protein YvbJ